MRKKIPRNNSGVSESRNLSELRVFNSQQEWKTKRKTKCTKSAK